jgi:hypothetical protein
MKILELEDLPPKSQLWFLALAFSDLNDSEAAALSALHLVQIEVGVGVEYPQPSEHYKALIEIAIVRYGRPFKLCSLPDGKTAVRLPLSFLPEGAEIPHKMFMEIRDKTTAHSDMTVREVRVERMPDINGLQMWRGHTSSLSISPAQAGALALLAAEIRKPILERLRNLAPELYPNAAIGDIYNLLPE